MKNQESGQKRKQNSPRKGLKSKSVVRLNNETSNIRDGLSEDTKLKYMNNELDLVKIEGIVGALRFLIGGLFVIGAYNLTSLSTLQIGIFLVIIYSLSILD